MLNGIQDTFNGTLGGLLAITSQGGVSLFYIGVLASMPFIVFQLISAMNSGGGAGLIESIGFRIFVLFSMMALVTAWVRFAPGLETDIKTFAGVVAANGNPPADFTPDGVLATYTNVGNIIYQSGIAALFAALNVMNLWKLVTVVMILLGGVVSAIMLLLANVSLGLVFGITSFCVGFISWPFLRGFGDQFFGLIAGCAVFIIGVAAFVAIGSVLVVKEAALAPVLPTNVGMAGPQMLQIGVTSMLFAYLAAVVPNKIAERIAGGGILAGMAEMISFARRTIGK
jgi:hypothetical protein